MEFCPKSSWQCPEPLSLGSVALSALPCSGLVSVLWEFPPLNRGRYFLLVLFFVAK